MKMPSVMKGGHFSRLPKVEIPRSQFDRSFGLKTTLDAGYLVPLFWDEVLPGDTVNMSMNLFGRLATPIKPIMDNLYLDWFAFFVADRLVWDNFEKFMGAQDSPGASTDYLIPTLSDFVVMQHSLADYLGLAYGPSVGQYATGQVSALPFRSYNLVYNEFFRDQNLIPKLAVPTGDGPDDPVTTPYVLQRRGKRGDYFTTCLPWPQKGTAVRLPLANSSATANWANITSDGNPPAFKNNTGAVLNKTLQATTSAAASPIQAAGGSGTWTANSGLYWDTPHLIVNNTEMGTINQLRQAVQVQRLFEREARGGTRYIEWTKEVFGVSNPDFRLQRPEFLGSGSVPINVSPVAQTQRTDTGVSTPQANLAGVGTVSLQGGRIAKSFTEHGTLLVLCSIRADLNYQQNLLRKWTRRTKLDRAMPVTAHLGEQAVMLHELYYTLGVDPTTVFGYQERFAEYKVGFSQITGLFRSGVPGSIDVWHLAQNFGTPPTLGGSFISEDPPIDRVIAVPSEPHVILDGYVKATWARCLPTYGVPGMMDHF